ncbi:MAG: polyhydroxyalkanoate granule-associated phasin [Burkholderiaceae bacterium]
MNRRSRKRALRIGIQSAELMLAVPQVVSHRLSRIRAAGPDISVRDRRELQLMSSEKLSAFGESWNLMTLEVVKAQQQMAHAWMTAWRVPFDPSGASAHRASAHRSFARAATQMQTSILRVMSGGLRPVHRRATANARRLAGVKVR